MKTKSPKPKKVQLINDMDPIIEDNTALLAQIVKNISNGPTMNEDSRKTEEYDPLNEDENAFDEFKLHKKPLHLPNLNGLGPYEESPEPMQVEEKKSAAKKYEEPIQLADIENNKLIDQEVLKNAVNVFFDKTYSNVSERLNHHLRSDIADSILEEINKKHKTE